MKGFFIFPIKFSLLIFILLLIGCAGQSDVGEGVNWDAIESGDYTTALKELKPLAEQGEAAAQYNLGVMYYNGWGVIQNYKAAVKWYKLAAEQGDADAQYNLGLMYSKGRGLIKDYTLAHMWSNIAASQGNKSAMNHREIIENKMTLSQIEKAQDLARECVAKNYRDC